MTKERLAELYGGFFIGDEHYEPAMDFARAILFECAKMVCVNCKEGNPSEKTSDPTRRIHKLSKNYQESCRAVAFFIQGE